MTGETHPKTRASMSVIEGHCRLRRPYSLSLRIVDGESLARNQLRGSVSHNFLRDAFIRNKISFSDYGDLDASKLRICEVKEILSRLRELGGALQYISVS